MEKKLLFSFLVPNYGYSNLLFDCFDSLVNQRVDDNFDFEIVMCDQSDKEDYEKIVNEFSKRYGDKVKIVYSEIKGSLRARHNLMNYAKGDYIAFIDSDDFVDLDYLSVLYRKIKENDFPDVFITSYILCNYDGKDDPRLYTPFECEQSQIMDYFIYSYQFNEIVRKIFKRELYQGIEGADLDIKNCDDWTMTFPIMLRAKTIVYDKSVQKYHYRINQNSLTHKFTKADTLKNFGVHERYLKDLSPNEFQKNLFNTQLIRMYLVNCDVLTKNKDFTKEDFKEVTDLLSSRLYELKENNLSKKHKLLYLLLRKHAYGRLRLIFKIRKVL